MPLARETALQAYRVTHHVDVVPNLPLTTKQKMRHGLPASAKAKVMAAARTAPTRANFFKDPVIIMVEVDVGRGGRQIRGEGEE